MVGVDSFKFPLERVVELETELKEVREAFDQYVSNTQGIEDGLDKELAEMRAKLASSTAANEKLESQLQKMHPMVVELEKSLEANKTRLKEESKLRRQADAALLEGRDQSNDDMASLRQENGCLREELERFKIKDKLRGGNKSASPRPSRSSNEENNGSDDGDHDGDHDADSYRGILDKLEGVTEQLIDTQQNLWVAEDKLRESQSRVKTLDSRMQELEKEAKRNNEKSLLDLTEDETFDTAAVTIVDQSHAQELERVHRQLQEARKDLRNAEEKAERAHFDARLAHDNAKSADGRSKSFANSVHGDSIRELEELQDELEICQDELEESKEENATLLEEISCLREILQENGDRERLDAQKNAEQRTTELNGLRAKLREIVKQNAMLQEKVDQLEQGVPTSRDDEILHLKKEMTKLKGRFQIVGEENTNVMNDSEIEWHLRLEKLRNALEDEKEEDMTRLRDEMLEERDIITTSLQDRVEHLQDEKYDLEEKVKFLERKFQQAKKEKIKLADHAQLGDKELGEAKDEIVALKKKVGILSTDLKHVKGNLAKIESESKQEQDQYAAVCAELEVARQVLDEAGLEGETIAREDEIELKRQIHSLSKSLEQSRQDYAELENDFLDSQHRFCDSQEEAHRKTSDEIHYLTGKISEMEAALETARADYSEVTVQLERARKESFQSLKKGEKQGRESTIRTLKLQRRTARQGNDSADASGLQDLQQQIGELMSQLDKVNEELRDCKSELETTRNENMKLKQAISDHPETENNSQKALGKDFDDEGLDSNGDSLNQKYMAETEVLEVLSVPSKERNLLNPLSWFASDAAGISRIDSEELHSKLLHVTQENNHLKEKISGMVSSSQIGTSKQAVLETSEIRQVIRELEEALRGQERLSDELERVSQKLVKSDKRLTATQKALDQSDEENGSLRSEVRELKAAVSDLAQNLQDAQTELESRIQTEDKFHELRDQLTGLTDERASLQHQLDDAKIALSVSQYAQERSKEELKISESNLLASSDEVFRLRDEVNSISQSLSDVKQAYDDVVNSLKEARSSDDDARKAVSKLSKKMTQLSHENSSLQSTVSELEAALKLVQSEISNKTKELGSVRDKLSSKQEESKVLMDEISRLTAAAEASKAEYNLMVEELESVCELFEDARQEAKRDGKETAIREIQMEMEDSREQQRDAMKAEAKKIFEKSGAMQRKLAGVENALAQAKSAEEVASMSREIKILKDALKTSDEEVKRLKGRETKLSVALKESKHDLRQARDELQLLNQSMDDSRKAAERTARESAAEVFRSMDNSEELLQVREKLKILLENTEEVTMGADSVDPDGGHRAEGLRLKMELLDMSMSLEKIMKENAIIEEELEHLRYAAQDARKEGEKEGVLKATSKIRKEMKEQRDQEMREFNERFYELAEENSSLSLQLRDAEVKLALAINTKEDRTDDVAELQKDLESAKAEALKFERNVFDLSSELKALRDERQRTENYLTSSASSESNAQTKEMQANLQALTLENKKIQNRLRGAESELRESRNSEERAHREMESLLDSLQESKSTIGDLEAQVSKLSEAVRGIKSTKEELSSEKAAMERKLKLAESALEQAKSSTLGDVETKALKAAKEENSKLKSLTTQLKRTLEESTKELDRLREQFDRVCSNVAARDENEANALRVQLHKLAEEKAVLQKQVDETKLLLALQKYSYDTEGSSSSRERAHSPEREDRQKPTKEHAKEDQEDATKEKQSTKEPTNNTAAKKISSSDHDAEMRLLQDQFKKLAEKSENLGGKVEEAENAVSQLRSRQETTRREADLRKKQALDLQDQVEKALEETRRRDEDLKDLSGEMGNRVSMAEKNVHKLESEISVAMGKLEVTEAGLFFLRKESSGTKPATSNKTARPAMAEKEQRDSGNIDEDESIHSAEEGSLTQTESREDMDHTGRDEPPPIQENASKDTNLTSRALEAIARSRKKNSLRKLELQAAQSKLFGGSRNPSAERGSEEVSARDLQ